MGSPTTYLNCSSTILMLVFITACSH
jgi:hypothetical protein